MRRSILVFLAVCLSSAAGVIVRAQSASGPEFQVNTYTTGGQGSPSAAMDGNGNFVVVWQSSGPDGSSDGIRGRLFDSAGMAMTPEFAVNTYTTGAQKSPVAAMDGLGNFVVVWHSPGQDGSGSGVFGRRFGSAGAPVGGEFQVNSASTDSQSYASVAADLNGNFVVVWQTTQGMYSQGIFGRRFSSSGSAVGQDFQVHTYASGSQATAAVAMSPAGGFMAVWSSFNQDGDATGIFGQAFSSSGAAQGSEFQANQFTTGFQADASIASDINGNFLVVWDDNSGQDGDGTGLFARRVSSSGSAQGGEFQVNSYTTSHQYVSKVAHAGGDSFVVAWVDYAQDGDFTGIFGATFDTSGSPLGNEFMVNTTTANGQGNPSISADDQGRFVVAWTSYAQDGDSTGIFAQRFGGSGGGCMAGDTDADGVCDDVDNCPGLANPGQDNSDGDGRGDSCDIFMMAPLSGGTIDCSDPLNIKPTIAWEPGFYDRFTVEIAWVQGFPKGSKITSGDTPLKVPFYTPPTKKMRKACAQALAADPITPMLFIQVVGKDRDVSSKDPDRNTTSDVVDVNVTF